MGEQRGEIQGVEVQGVGVRVRKGERWEGVGVRVGKGESCRVLV